MKNCAEEQRELRQKAMQNKRQSEYYYRQKQKRLEKAKALAEAKLFQLKGAKL